MNTRSFHTPARAFRLLTLSALIGLTGTVLQTAQAAPGGMGGYGERAAMGMDGPGHMVQNMGRMLDRVGASAEQKAQIKTIMESAGNDIKPLRAQMKTLRDQSAVLFTQPAVDANAVDAVRLQMQAAQNQVGKRMQQALIESSRVLTPDQRTKMADMMNKRRAMAERHRAEAESLTGNPAAAK